MPVPQPARQVCFLSMAEEIEKARQALDALGFDRESVLAALSSLQARQAVASEASQAAVLVEVEPEPEEAEFLESGPEPGQQAEERGHEAQEPGNQVVAFSTPTKNRKTSSVSSPGSSPRPVCWSLHKFFQPARKETPEQVDLSTGPVNTPPHGSSAKAQEADKAAEENRLAVQDSLPEPDRSLVQRNPVKPFQRQKGGRPKLAEAAPRGTYHKATARVRDQWCKWMQKELALGRTKTAVQAEVHRKTGVCEKALDNWWKQRERWAQWVIDHPDEGQAGGLRKRGSNVKNSHLKSKSQGCRIAIAGKKLGRTDHCLPFVQGTQVWAEQEESMGHSLARQDLFREFSQLLDEGIRQAKAEAEAGTLSPELAKSLAAWVKKAVAIKDRRKRDKQAAYLVRATEFKEKATNRATTLSQDETDRRLQAGWKWWDFMIWLAGCADSTTLAHWVAQAELFVLHRGETVITLSDQSPVWLRPEAARVLVSEAKSKAAARYQQLKKQAAKAGLPAPPGQPHSHVRGPGEAAAARWRVTLVARQAILYYFRPDGIAPRGQCSD